MSLSATSIGKICARHCLHFTAKIEITFRRKENRYNIPYRGGKMAKRICPCLRRSSILFFLNRNGFSSVYHRPLYGSARVLTRLNIFSFQKPIATIFTNTALIAIREQQVFLKRSGNIGHLNNFFLSQQYLKKI